MKPFDEHGRFRPSADGDELRRLAVRGAGATLLSSGTALVVQVVATVVLARLLTPSDFGLVAMVTTFSLLLVNFGLNGFTEAVLQWEKIDHVLASNLFWINLGAGCVLTVVFAAAGSMMAWFYDDPRVVRVAVGISLTIFMTSTSVLHLALLKRGLYFSSVSANDVFSRAISVAVSILLAWAGWGYWALVAGAAAQPLSQSIGAWSICRWIPGIPQSVSRTFPMVRFAMNIYGRFSVNYFARNTDNLLVGWRFGSSPLGFYKKAYDLFLLSASQLVSPLTAVAVASLSRLNSDPARYRRYLLRALAVTAFVGMWLGANLTLIGRDLILLLLGPAWGTAGRIFTFFGPGVGIMVLYSTHGWIHLSIGRADRWFRWVFVEFTATSAMFLVGLPWGPEGVAVAWAASFWILAIPAFWYAGRPIDFRVGLVVAAVWKYVVASLLASGTTWLIVRRLPPASTAVEALVRIVKVSVLLGIAYLGTVILLHWGFAPLHELARLLRDMVPWRKRSVLSAALDPRHEAGVSAGA